jgi:hypothetical protein
MLGGFEYSNPAGFSTIHDCGAYTVQLVPDNNGPGRYVGLEPMRRRLLEHGESTEEFTHSVTLNVPIPTANTGTFQVEFFVFLDKYPLVNTTYIADITITQSCASWLPDDFELSTESSPESPQSWYMDETLTKAVIDTVDLEFCELAWSLSVKDATDANSVYSDASTDFQAIYDETN